MAVEGHFSQCMQAKYRVQERMGGGGGGRVRVWDGSVMNRASLGLPPLHMSWTERCDSDDLDVSTY